ncbi:hypothetical protein ACFQ5M_04720 [Agrilactobacillus yilanensis]|uniref:DUF1328 domain-containing protein n=1 Tax=Agrilactobacillus yilanensis TaxID=2485997 RepID=A0ABW4J722_9LACO|nr:hypothetical protein [Agrilactobacillus yilanensis]
MRRSPHFLRGILFLVGALLCVLIIFIEFTHGILGIGPIRVMKLWLLVAIFLVLALQSFRG